MAADSGAELRVPIGITVDTNAGDAADDIAELRDRISASKDAIRDAAKQMSDLKGKTTEVVAAKDQLKAKLDAERDALAKATVKLVAQGTSFDQLKAKQVAAAAAAEKVAHAEDDMKKKIAEAAVAAKKAAKDQEAAAAKVGAAEKDKHGAIGKALGAAGGPIAGAASKVDALKEALGGASGAELALVAGAAAVIAAILAIAAATVKVAYELGKFILVSADARRSQELLAAAALNGHESWATILSKHVDQLASKIPLARDKINAIGISLAKSRIGGQVMVDTLNAAGQAAAAFGDDSSKKIEEFVARGRVLQRFRIDPEEMIGTGVDFKDVAEALSKSMHVGVNEAAAALRSGRVKLGDGAKALRDAVEKKVGTINLKQMLSLEHISETAGKAFSELTKGVNINPAIEAVGSVLKVFDQSTTTGRVLKEMIGRIGNATVQAFTKGGPIAKAFIQGMIIGALKLENAYLRVRVKLHEAFGGSDVLKNVDTLKLAMQAGEVAMVAMAAAVVMTAGFIAVAAAPFIVLGAAVYGVYKAMSVAKDAVVDTYNAIAATDWSAAGGQLIDGFINGIKAGLNRVKDAVAGVGTTAIKALKEALDSHSPSRKMFEIGADTTAGYAGGVEHGTPDAQAAVDNMIGQPSSSGGAAAGGGGGGAQITFAPIIQVSGGGGDLSAQLSDPALLQPLQQMFMQVLRTAGFPVPT